MISVFWILETKSLASELFYRSSLYTLDSSTSVVNLSEIFIILFNNYEELEMGFNFCKWCCKVKLLLLDDVS